MKLKRIQIAIEAALALVLLGLGHYYVSTQRAIYPLDGYAYYAAALLVCWHLVNSTRAKTDPVWNALAGSFRSALALIWHSLHTLLPVMSLRVRFAIVIAINILAAIFALALPSGWWLILWLGSIVLLLSPFLARSISAATASVPRPWVEPSISIDRAPNLIGLLISIGLLIAGQMVIVSSAASFQIELATSINEAWRLGLANPSAALSGLASLTLGLLLFAIVTRRSAVIDVPRLCIDAPVHLQKKLSNWWIAVGAIGFAIWLSVIRAVGEDATGWGGVLPWLLSIGLIALCWWQIDRTRGVRLAIQLDRSEWIVLGLAAIAILIVFIFQLRDVPNSLWGDEGAFFSIARDMAQGKYLPDFFGFGAYGTFPAPGSFFQSFFLAIFGANIFAWRLGSAVAALLVIFPLYFLVRATLGKRVAWLSIVLYAALPYLLTYARLGYNNSQSIAPVALTLLLTWLAAKRASPFFAFLAGCAGGLGFLTYTAAELGIVVALGWLIWMWLVRSGQRRTIAIAAASYLLGSAMVAGPTLAYQTARAPQMFAYKQAESIFANVIYARDLFPDEQLFATTGSFRVGDQELFYDPTIYSTLLGRGVIRTALGFQTSSVVNENYLISALADPLGAIYLLGLGWCLIRLRRPAYAIWPAWLIVGAVALSVIDTYPPRAAHMLPVVPAIAVLGALGLVAGVDLLARVVGGLPDRVKSIVLIGAATVLVLLGLKIYFIDMPPRFPPDLENTMFWQAQSMPRGSDITLIQPDGLPNDFVPWGLRELDLGVNFHLIKPADFAVLDPQSLCPAECRFFFIQSNYSPTYERLIAIFGMKPIRKFSDQLGPNGFYEFNPNE
jgi:4-amino-4-deoxy-L-arabinose transferase-like glycosyltransferase